MARLKPLRKQGLRLGHTGGCAWGGALWEGALRTAFARGRILYHGPYRSPKGSEARGVRFEESEFGPQKSRLLLWRSWAIYEDKNLKPKVASSRSSC